MKKYETKIKDLIIIEPELFNDERGWFMESYSKKKFEEIGININFIQENTSFSNKKGTLRGLHCQLEPFAQTKLVSCIKGKILDVVVDIRKGSPSYLKTFKIELSEENNLMLLVPKGFLHGFVTLEDNCKINYKVDNYYSSSHDRSIKFNDKSFNINWELEDFILSKKDLNAPLFSNSDINFIYKEE